MKRAATPRKPRASRPTRKICAAGPDPAAAISPQVSVRAGAALPIPAKWAWHYRTLLRLRERLAAERDERLHAATASSEPHNVELEDRADNEVENDLLFAEIRAEEGMLTEIEAALQRLRRGNYGVCEESGEAIPRARLRAMPWARYLRRVAARLEQSRSKQS
jgi:DnaK suppressor protein